MSPTLQAAKPQQNRDPFYTPEHVATDLIQLDNPPRAKKHALVADFAAGEGDLLRLAAVSWKDVCLFATDIDRRIVARLKRKQPHWEVGCVNFLADRSRRGSRLLKQLRGRVDIVLLNPPFSCRGGTQFTANFEGAQTKCSAAMAFVVLGLSYLRAGGELRAILPASVLSSQKDMAIRRALAAHIKIEVARHYSPSTFRGCCPSTVLVRFLKVAPDPCSDDLKQLPSRHYSVGTVELSRGSYQMHRILHSKNGNGTPLIHTTDLGTEDVLSNARRILANGRSLVTGPAVLMQRVGKPDSRKIAIVQEGQEVALSDCIFALKTSNMRRARGVAQRMRSNWSKIEGSFSGTGAPYLTLGRLADSLESIGIGIMNPADASFQYVQSLESRTHFFFDNVKRAPRSSKRDPDLPPRVAPPSKLDPGPTEVHSKG